MKETIEVDKDVIMLLLLLLVVLIGRCWVISRLIMCWGMKGCLFRILVEK